MSVNNRTKRLGRYEPIRVMQQSASPTTNADGEQPEVETEYIRRWALVLERRGTEKAIAGQLEADATRLVYMHNDAAARSMTTRNWILRTSRGNARLNILAIRETDDGMELELQCNERDEP